MEVEEVQRVVVALRPAQMLRSAHRDRIEPAVEGVRATRHRCTKASRGHIYCNDRPTITHTACDTITEPVRFMQSCTEGTTYLSEHIPLLISGPGGVIAPFRPGNICLKFLHLGPEVLLEHSLIETSL